MVNMRMPFFGKKSPTRTVFHATGQVNERTTITDTDFKQFIDDDAVLNSNLKQITDAIFEFPMEVDKHKDSKISETKLKDRNKQLKNVNFSRKVKEAYPGLWYNGNMFFEIVITGNKVKEFYWIDPSTMKVKEDDFGNPIKYIQRQPSGDKVLPKDRIIHIKAPSLRTGVIGEPLLKPLKFPLNRKRVAENYMAGMVENLQPLLYIEMGEADDYQAQSLKNAIRAKREPDDPMKLISLLPGEKVSRVDTGSTDNFDAILRYINAQNDEIIRVVQIPPIVAGTVDNSNRSNSEIQERAVFGRTVAAWQEWLRNEFNLIFKDKVEWDDSEFQFPESDDRKQEAALVRAQKLREIGYSQKAVHETLVDAGFKIKNDFEEDLGTTNINKDIDNMPSRQARPKEGIPQNEAQRQRDVQNGTKKQSQ